MIDEREIHIFGRINKSVCSVFIEHDRSERTFDVRDFWLDRVAGGSCFPPIKPSAA